MDSEVLSLLKSQPVGTDTERGSDPQYARRAARRKLIRTLHWDFFEPVEDSDVEFSVYMGFDFSPNIILARDLNSVQPPEPGFLNLLNASNRSRLAHTDTTVNDFVMTRERPFSVFKMTLVSYNYDNMTLHIFGERSGNVVSSKKVVVGTTPRTVSFPSGMVNLNTLRIRESQLQADVDAKALHAEAAPEAPAFFGIVDIQFKLTDEKYLVFPEVHGNFA